jgi:hypothetical protein
MSLLCQLNHIFSVINVAGSYTLYTDPDPPFAKYLDLDPGSRSLVLYFAVNSFVYF